MVFNSVRRDRKSDQLGLILWLIAFAVILMLTVINPDARSVVPQYRLGSTRFLEQAPLYDLNSAMGYLYAPGFAALYVPFLKLGPVFGDVLWRLAGFAVLTFAVFRQARILMPRRAVAIASLALLLALPVSLGSLRNGQSTILLTGACWFLTFATLEGRHRSVFLWAAIAILAKPTAIVMLLLCGALRPRVIPALLLAIVAVVAVPYLMAPPGYVNESQVTFARLLTSMSVHESGPFVPADFTAPFTAVGLIIPESIAMAIRVVLAPLTLALVLWYDRRLDRRLVALGVFLAATFYMSIMNPRVEHSTYSLMAAPCGVALALIWEQGRTRLAWGLGALMMAPGFIGIERTIHAVFDLWLRPVTFTIVATVLLIAIARMGTASDRLAEAPAHG